MALELSAPLPLDRRDKLLAAILAAVALVAGYWWMVGGVCGIYHDDAIYVATAKALAGGQGYRLINLPAAPLQTKYPILYPAILALIWKLWPSFPGNLAAMQALSLLAGGAVTGLAYLYLVRFGYCTRGAALAAIPLFSAHPAIFTGLLNPGNIGHNPKAPGYPRLPPGLNGRDGHLGGRQPDVGVRPGPGLSRNALPQPHFPKSSGFLVFL